MLLKKETRTNLSANQGNSAANYNISGIPAGFEFSIMGWILAPELLCMQSTPLACIW